MMAHVRTCKYTHVEKLKLIVKRVWQAELGRFTNFDFIKQITTEVEIIILKTDNQQAEYFLNVIFFSIIQSPRY